MRPSSIIPLYAYQRRWIEDDAPLKGGLWSRDAGKTFAVMLEPVLDCFRHDVDGKKTDWFCFSAAEVQTTEMIRYAAMHCRAIDLGFNLVEEEHDVRDERGDRKVTMLALHFKHGSRIVGLPTNAFSIRGKHGNLIGDEAGKWPRPEEIWQAAAPIASREGKKVRLVGTPGERRGIFYEVFGSGTATGWSRHRVDVYQAIAEGCPIDLAKVKSMVGVGRRFKVEYELLFEEADCRLIPLELIIPCEVEGAELVPVLRIGDEHRRAWQPYVDTIVGTTSVTYDDPRAWHRLFAPLDGRRLYLGFDVGRKHDLSTLHIIEPDGLLRWWRAVVSLHRRRFAEQRACLWAAIEMCQRACIDGTGIGAQLAEESQEHFGAHRVEIVDFTAAVKEDLAVRMLRQFEDRTARLPPSLELRESIHAVYKQTTAAGNVRYDAEATDESGHADHFWGGGLALMAAGDGPQSVPQIETIGRSAWRHPSMGTRSGGLL